MVLKTIQYLYYCLFILTPLLMSSKTSEMFEFNKMLYIYLITTIVFGLWCIHYIVRRPQLYLPKKMIIFLLLFVVVLSISTYYSIDKHTSIFGYYGRWNGGLISIMSYVVLFFVFIQVFTKETVHTLLKLSLLTSVIVMVWGYLAKFGIDFSCYLFIGDISNTCWTAQFQPSIRMFSTLGQPNWLGAYLSAHFFIALFYFLNTYPLLKDHESLLDKAKHVLAKFHMLREPHPFGSHMFYAGYLVLNFIAIYFTKSRSSLLAVGVSLLIGAVIIFTIRVHQKYRLWVRIALISFIIMMSSFLVNTRSSSFYEKAPANLEITDSFEIRKIVWTGAIELGKQYPLFGTGPETFAYSYFFTKPVAHNNTSEWDFIYNKAHNEYLNYLATTGYIGFAAYLLVISMTLYSGYFYAKRYRSSRNLVLFISLSYVTILITNFFGFSTSTIQLFFFLFPGMILVLDQKEQKDLLYKDILKNPFATKIMVLGVVVLMSFSIAYLYRYHQADRLYKQSKDQSYQDNYQEAVLLVTKAIKLKYEHVYEDHLSSSLANLAFIMSFDNDQAVSSKLITLSQDANAHTLANTQNNIQYWKTRAKNHYLYFQVTRDTTDLERSVDSMKHVISLSPTDAQSYYMLGLFYSVLSQETGEDSYKAKAIESTQMSLKLRPGYIEARELLGHKSL